MRPIYTAISKLPEMQHIPFLIAHSKIDYDEDWYFDKCKIGGFPTTMILYNGKPVRWDPKKDDKSGTIVQDSKAKLVNWIKKYYKP